jgi:hypothetical protein
VHIFPWVVGICGLIDPSCIVSLFTFLDASRKHHKTAIERTVLASVKAFYFMHQVRFGGMHDRHRFADNPRNDSSDEDATDDEELRSDPYGRRRNRLAKTAGIRAAELHHKLVPDTVLDKRKRLVWEPIIPHSSPRGQQIATGASDNSGTPDRETRKMPNMTGFNYTQTNTMLPLAARSADEAEATMSVVLDLVSSTANMAVTADIAPKDEWSTIAAAAPVEKEVVKYVGDVTGATVNTAISTTAHSKTMTTCAAGGVMPTCGTRLALNSGFAAVAPITGGQAEETDTRTVGSSELLLDMASLSPSLPGEPPATRNFLKSYEARGQTYF